MKKLILILLLDKWLSTTELGFIVPNKTEYNYSFNNVGTLDSKISLAFQYSINYQVYNKLSIGALVGIQEQYGPNFFMYKIGANIRYNFVDAENAFAYFQYSPNFTVNKDKFKNGNNLRIGIGLPFFKKDNFNLNLNIFHEINHFNLSGSKPLIFGNEKPESIYFRSFGISLGVKF
jgi:hypothetical protein